jgi:hypothetical protein
MHIDWAALAIVAVVSIAASVIFTILLASGIRLVSAAKIKSNEGGFRYRDRLAGLSLARHRRADRALWDLPDRSAVPLEGTLIVDLCSAWARQPSLRFAVVDGYFRSK